MHTTRIAIAVAILLVGAPAWGASVFVANLSDAQEVAPGGTSDTTGTAQADLELIEVIIDPYYGGVSIALSVDIVFDPVWDRSMMSESAKLQLGMMW